MYIENRDIDIIENKYSSLPICSRLSVHRVGSNLRRSARFFFVFFSLPLFFIPFFPVYFLIIPRYFLCRASIKIQLTELNRFRVPPRLTAVPVPCSVSTEKNDRWERAMRSRKSFPFRFWARCRVRCCFAKDDVANASVGGQTTINNEPSRGSDASKASTRTDRAVKSHSHGKCNARRSRYEAEQCRNRCSYFSPG